MSRLFNDLEHAALFLAAGGKCARCGRKLKPGWHADHIQPQSLGGETDVVNGQALCPTCNLQKGNRGARVPDGEVRLSIVETRRQVGALVDAAYLRGECTVITKNGEPRAMVVPFDRDDEQGQGARTDLAKRRTDNDAQGEK